MTNLKETYPLWNLDKFYYKWDDKTLRIGTDDTGSWNIPDDNGTWKYMISICNGELTTNEICVDVSNKYSIEQKTILESLKQLEQNGCLTFLEDRFILNDWTNRYKTNIAYFTSKNINGITAQKKLNSLKITILGLGGGGFTILSNLISLGVEDFHIVDFDTVELSNLNRQIIFKESDLGKLKVEVGMEYAKSRNSNLKISQSKKKMNTVADIESEISDSDWVFCCMDEPAYIAQRLVSKACFNLKKPVIFGFCQKENGRTFIVNPSNTGCVDCLFTQIANDQFVHLVSALKKSDFKPVTSATSITINLLCDLMIKNWLDNVVYGKKNENQIIRLDFNDFQMTKVVDFKKHPSCPTCGDKQNLNQSELFNIIPIS
ncbi:ThiF family adenylyltransferase [Lactococcus lactis]